VPTLEDKIVQRSTAEVLNAICETDFLGFSYGFRPGRNPHQALDALAVGLMKRHVNWVLDADIRGFFDALDHAWLVKFIEHRVSDRRIVRLIQKWLKAGVLEDGVRTRSESGTIQGGSISPLLANLYLHYVFDLWVQRWRQQQAKGALIVVRFADDFVVGFEHRSEAVQFLAELRERFAKFALELHPDKTRLIEFGKYAADHRRQRGEGKPETFAFLGFTHMCAKTRQGYYSVVRHTVRKRQFAKVAEIKRELYRRMHDTVQAQGAYLRSVVAGYIRYFGVPFNSRAILDFRMEVAWHWWRTLKRRSQRHRMTWKRMKPHVDRWLPPAHICHPQPLARFRATHPRQEPDAGNLHVRICGGGHE
jgi:group II intron reverse transcriptase/maturase